MIPLRVVIVAKKSIVVDGVTYYREHPDLEKAKEVLEKYDNLVWKITYQLQTAQELYNDFKAQELTFNTIEAEGFLRSIKEISDYVDYLKGE